MNRLPKFPISIWGKLQSKKYKRESENRFEFLELSFDWNCLDTPLCGPLSVVIKDFCFPNGVEVRPIRTIFDLRRALNQSELH